MQKSCDLLFHRQVTIGVWAVAGESPPPAWTCLFCTLPTFSSTYSLLFPLPSKKWLVGVWLRLKRPGTKVISGTKDWEHFFLGPKSWNVPDKNRNNPSITQDCPGLKTSISTFSQNTPVSFFCCLFLAMISRPRSTSGLPAFLFNSGHATVKA